MNFGFEFTQFTAVGPADVGFSTHPDAELPVGAAFSGKGRGVIGKSGWHGPSIDLQPNPSDQAGVLGFGEIGVIGHGYEVGVFGRGHDPLRSEPLPGGVGVRGESESNNGVEGWSHGLEASGVYGEGNFGITGRATSGGGAGVHGYADDSVGVRGTSQNDDGVVGSTNSPGKSGVFGYNLHDQGPTFGVSGTATSPDGAGINGFSDASVGVRGTSKTNEGIAGSSETAVGVRGTSQHDDGIAGSTDSPGKSGVFGYNLHDQGPTFGVSGTTTSPDGAGINGFSDASVGVLGTSKNNVGVVGHGGTYGGAFGGGQASVRLIPAQTTGQPADGAHEIGELFVDAEGSLFFCKGGGTPGTWVQIA